MANPETFGRVFEEICERLSEMKKLEYLSIQAPLISSNVLSSLSSIVSFNEKLEFFEVNFMIPRWLNSETGSLDPMDDFFIN